MNSKIKKEETTTVPDVLLEGLLQDVSILDALLKRHRCSHGRTIYFRRMSMALNRLLRTTDGSDGKSRKMIVVTDMVSRLDNLQSNILEYNREQKNKTSRKRRHYEEQEQWDLESLKKPTGTKLSPSQLIVQDFQELILFWTNNIPEMVSRIQHASKPLFIEVGRGFFLPFCTVALGALARIRSLLMEIGIRGLTTIRSLSEEALQMLPQEDASSLRKMMSDADFEKCTSGFLEDDNSESERKRHFLLKSCSTATQDVPVDREAILRSLGLKESTKGRSKPAAGRTNHQDIVTDDNKLKANTTAMDSPSADDFYTLSSSAPDGANDVEMDDGVSVDNDKLPPQHDSLDRNMALVNQFQKQKVAEKQTKKKPKKSKKSSDEESERKSKKRKKEKKESSKPKKKKKKDKSDFFDSIFD